MAARPRPNITGFARKTPSRPEAGLVAIFRTSLDRTTLERWIRRECREIDPILPVTIDSMDDRVDRFRERPRFVTSLVTIFAALGLLLASVGLYGVLSFLVTQQTREIGVRVAIGARPADIAWAVEKYAGIWTGLGVAVGLAGVFSLTRAIRGFLFEVSPGDPASLAAAVAVLVVVAALAALAPAWRAAHVDPAIALRHE